MSEKFSVFAKTAWLYPARLKGGHVQPQVQVRIITNLVDFSMTNQEAIAAERFNHIDGLKVGLEPIIPESRFRN
jgi:gamma-glutamyltranspeptidase